MPRSSVSRLTPSRRRARQRRIVAAVAISAAGALLAVFVDAEPTGLAAVDAVYRMAYVFLVAMACATAKRWTWPVVAGAAAVAGLRDLSLVLGGLALVVAAVAQLDRRRRQPVGALVGVLSALALLQLPPFLGFGAPSLVAALAPLPAVASALATMRSRVRRPVLLAAGAVGAVALVVVVAFGVGVLLLRSDADQGVDAARAGLDALRRGEQDVAADAFAVAARSFDDANDVATAWWMAPAKGVPVLAQHLDVARSLTDEGGRLARVSARTAPAVSLDDLTTDDGAFRLERIAELEPLASDVVDALVRGQRRLERLSTHWLTPPMVDAVDSLRDEIDTSRPDAELAVEALDLAPQLLGADAPKRYVVLFGNPAEAREMGGFVASLGVLAADGGRLEFTAVPDIATLERQLAEVGAQLRVEVPDAFRSASPERYVRTWTDSPDIGTVTEVVADLYPQLPEGGPVDGVLYLDPYVVADLLEITGEVTIPETGEVLTAENAVDWMLRDQYLSDAFEQGAERKERLGAAGEVAFARLLDGGLPRPRALATRLSPLVQGRRLLFSTTDPAAHGLLAEVGLRPAVDEGTTDTLLVTHGNRRPSKLDSYLRRTIEHRAEVGDDGTMTASVTVELTNEAPRAGLVQYQTGVPRPGDPEPAPANVVTLDVYSRLDETEVLVDGQPAAYNRSPAYGLNQYTVPVAVPAGATVVIEVRLTGATDPASCAVSVLPNAGASPDRFSSTMVLPQATRVVSPQVLDEPLMVRC